MDQTSQAAAIAIAIAATSGVFGMLTVFALASRTPAASRARRAPVPSTPQGPDVVGTEGAVAPPPTAPVAAVVKQRGIPASFGSIPT